MAAPLTPPECDLRGLPFMPLDCARLLDSDLFALTTGDEFKAALSLWCKSWTQVPAASMPDNELLLAKAAGTNLADWRAVSEMALKGWIKCDDGRLYHPVVAEKALTAWLERIAHREKSAKGSAARYPTFKYDPEAFESERQEALSCLASVAPAAARALGHLPQAGETPTPSSKSPAPSTAPSTEKGCEGRGRGIIPVGASETPDGKAWREGVSLLTANGRMQEKPARAFFAKLLKTYRLEPYRLAPSILKAQNTGTLDPQGYLTGCAKALSLNETDAKPLAVVESWDDDTWRSALSGFRERGAWDRAVMGPLPDEPGCWAPAAVLTEWRAAA